MKKFADFFINIIIIHQHNFPMFEDVGSVSFSHIHVVVMFGQYMRILEKTTKTKICFHSKLKIEFHHFHSIILHKFIFFVHKFIVRCGRKFVEEIRYIDSFQTLQSAIKILGGLIAPHWEQVFNRVYVSQQNCELKRVD